MNKITHAAAKKIFSGVVDYALGQVNKTLTRRMKRLLILQKRT